MTTYVIGDIAGNYKTLLALIDQLPEPKTIISVGDIVDRGPRSKEVIEYFRTHPEHIVLKGNHEDLLLNDRYTWLDNGGKATLKSFDGEIPSDVKEWLEALPINHMVELDGKKFYISHAPTPNPKRPWREEPQVLWNRYEPEKMEGVFLQIFGHNSIFEWFPDRRPGPDGKPSYISVCIDDCRNDILTALELPSLKVYQQPYID